MTDITWDSALYETSFKFIPAMGEELIALLTPQPGERILDLGCGTGSLTHKITSYGAFALGIDSSPEMIEQARHSYPDLQFVVARGEEFRVSPEERFDAIFSNAAIHWMKDAEAVVQRMYDALKPRGRVVAELGGKGNVSGILDALERGMTAAGYTFENPWYFPSIGEYASLLEKYGFRVTYAAHFDRSSPLEGGEQGLTNWLTMFAGGILKAVPPEARSALTREVERHARASLYHDGVWVADYVRLRIIALKEA